MLLGRDFSSVSNKARQMRLKQDRVRVRKGLERPTLEAARYISPTEPAVAYILGLLWADGCVTHAGAQKVLRVIRHTCRFDDAESFSPVFASLGGWSTFTYVNKKAISQAPIVSTSCSNRALGEHLAALGWKEKGASPQRVLDTIPGELHHHFYRGYFDGDGCITSQKQIPGNNKYYKRFAIYFSSCGNQDWGFLQSLCASLGIKPVVRQMIDKRGVASQLYFASSTQAEAFVRYIYRGHEGLCLARKLNKAQELLDYQINPANNKRGRHKLMPAVTL